VWLAQVTTESLGIAEWIARAGPTAILAVMIVGFLKGWIVTGSAYDQMRAERDRALELVYKHAGITERAVDVSVQRLDLEQQLLELRKREGGG
jgi:hypothetical protein